MNEANTKYNNLGIYHSKVIDMNDKIDIEYRELIDHT